MKLKNTLLIIFLAFIVFSCDNLDKAKTKISIAPPLGKPNIILIMADDLGYSDLGCYGSEINTPNLNKLAENGLRFTQFYNAGRSCPTRASLLTGLYPHQAGLGQMTDLHLEKMEVTGPFQGYLSQNSITLAELLKRAGYQTFMSGKWHVGATKPNWPLQRGFDKYFGLTGKAANYFDISKTRSAGVQRNLLLNNKPYQPGKDFYMTYEITNYALAFMDSAFKKDNPFFLYVAYTAPHWPLHAPDEVINNYRGKYMKGWEKVRNQRFGKMRQLEVIDSSASLSPPDPLVPSWRKVANKKEMDLKMAVYAAQIECMDKGIGKMMKKLEEKGKTNNTLVMFLSDNGASPEGGTFGFDKFRNGLPPGGKNSYMSYGLAWANVSNTPYRKYKAWMHEGGILTPFIAHWPVKIKQKGEVISQLASILDIMPTFCEIAQINYPDTFNGTYTNSLKGKSLLPIFEGQNREPTDFYCWSHYGNKAVRKGNWKLVSDETGQWHLFNMEYDPTELNDLSEAMPEKVSELKEIYKKWATNVGAESNDEIGWRMY